jgi:hypothetical protein
MTPHDEADLSLIVECDEAAERGFLVCGWCDAHGHRWKECPEYEAYAQKILTADRPKIVLRASWQTVLILLGMGFAAGMAFKALLEVM